MKVETQKRGIITSLIIIPWVLEYEYEYIYIYIYYTIFSSRELYLE